MTLELSDIQGGILSGYRFRFAMYLFLAMPDAPAGRAFLSETLDAEVTNAQPWPEGPKPATTTNVALTFAGLQQLGVPASVLAALPQAFRDPVRKRARDLLGDTGPNDPERWDDGLGSGVAHVLVLLAAPEQPQLEAVVAKVRERAQAHGLWEVTSQRAEALADQREHFGWADGFGQPAVEGAERNRAGQGVPAAEGRGWRDLKAGEFIFGYPDEDGLRYPRHAGRALPEDAAALLRNGTFMVYRKLEQDVSLFRHVLRARADEWCALAAEIQDPKLREDLQDAEYRQELLAAKLVGRWRDGVALELAPRRSAAEVADLAHKTAPSIDNDFRYAQDLDGAVCPRGAHVRRANPRDLPPWDEAVMSRRHRILRRGMPYGTALPKQGPDPEKGERGLIFVCFNADFERQFEFVQRAWLNDGNAFGIGKDRDFLLGDGRGKVTVEGEPPFFARGQAGLVTTKGCEYLLVPGLHALRRLAEAAPAAEGVARHPAEPAPPAGEAEATARVVGLVQERMREDYAARRPVLRGQHPKTHGLVHAEVIVERDIPPSLRHGIFAEPEERYEAWVRFSSSTAPPGSDAKDDAHGMAIKVLLEDPDGDREQDFVLVNHPTFFCRDALDYARFAETVTPTGSVRHQELTLKLRLARFFFPPLHPGRWRLPGALNLWGVLHHRVSSPLEIRYWSQTPYALGPHAVKFSARPVPSTARPQRRAASYDGLEDALVAALANTGAEFELLVQLQADPETTPVDDPTVPWREREAPFRRLARVRIPAQDPSDQACRRKAEELRFAPWHCLPEHRPLGSINRVRRAVYEASAQLRRELNDGANAG